MKLRVTRATARRTAFCAVLVSMSLAVHAAGSSVTIEGTPPAAIAAGQVYVFSPRAVVGGTGAPHFEVQNLPRWASFSAFSGRLSGTPVNTDAGVYPNIRISVTDGSSRASLPAFAITVRPVLRPRAATLNWAPPLENTDDSVLTDLAGYRIYSGPSPERLTRLITLSNPSLSRYVVEWLEAGQQYCFAVTAFNAAGRESPFSAIVTTTVE